MEYDVTIGIPVYQVEKYIRESLESALSQTFPNIEFLICDDCGTDTSIAIVREYQKKHSRGKDIRIVRQPHNMGLGCARNRMIVEAKGRYIFFMDSDDILSLNAIESLYEQAKKYDAERSNCLYYRGDKENKYYSQKFHKAKAGSVRCVAE